MLSGDLKNVLPLILDRIDPGRTFVLRAVEVSMPDAFRDDDNPDAPPGSWIEITTPDVMDDPTAQGMVEWYANLVVGTARLAATDDVLRGYTLLREAATGGLQRTAAGRFGQRRRRDPVVASPPAAVEAAIRSRALRNGLTLASVEVLDGGRPIPIVTIATASPERDLGDYDLVTKVLGDGPSFAAYAFRIVDDTGRLILQSLSEDRTGEGSIWVADEYRCLVDAYARRSSAFDAPCS